jgi:outer membrane autotransporter protein
MGTRAGGVPQAGAAGFADEDEALAYVKRKGRNPAEQDAYAAMARKAPPRAAFLRRWSVWGAGYGGTQSTDGNATVGSNDVTSRIYGGAAGFDYRLTPDTLVGFSLGGAGSKYNLANGLGSGRSDMFQAGVYGMHYIGPAYLAGALAYGWQDVTTDRTVLLNILRANFDANAVSGRLEGGYRFAAGMGGLTPYAAGQFTTFFLPDYAEQVVAGTNLFALSYASKDVTASRSELGLRADTSFAMQDAIVTLRGRAAWAHNFNTDRSVSAIFQTLPASAFVVNGAAQAENSALFSAGAEARWLNGFSVAATFEGEFSNVTESYAGKGVVRYQW